MLHVDLNHVERAGRARLDVDLPPNAEFWAGTELVPHSPLEVRLEAQQAGPDVVVRGTVGGEFELTCRRCLEPVVAGIEEDLGLLYREGEVGPDEAEDVLPLPAGAELDLSGPVREHVLLAVPKYVQCRGDCKGLCPKCGMNLNEATCECTSEEVDERWAPLRRLKPDA